MGSESQELHQLRHSPLVSHHHWFKGLSNSYSLSEYGCNLNTRKFEEVASLYSTNMTAVYSGGLVYEYSQEEADYGLVTISGTTVTELADFTALETAFQNTANPTGDGGYNSTGGASGCPAQSANWNVTGDALPAIPAAALAVSIPRYPAKHPANDFTVHEERCWSRCWYLSHHWLPRWSRRGRCWRPILRNCSCWL